MGTVRKLQYDKDSKISFYYLDLFLKNAALVQANQAKRIL